MVCGMPKCVSCIIVFYDEEIQCYHGHCRCASYREIVYCYYMRVFSQGCGSMLSIKVFFMNIIFQSFVTIPTDPPTPSHFVVEAVPV